MVIAIILIVASTMTRVLAELKHIVLFRAVAAGSIMSYIMVLLVADMIFLKSKRECWMGFQETQDARAAHTGRLDAGSGHYGPFVDSTDDASRS